jgi:hypothetical protein
MNVRRFWNHLGVLVAALVLSQGGAYLFLLAAGAAHQPYAGLIINTVFLLACVACIRLFSMSSQDVGLKILPPRFAIHVGLCLAILFAYFLYYLVGVRISNLHPITFATLWSLLTYLVISL